MGREWEADLDKAGGGFGQGWIDLERFADNACHTPLLLMFKAFRSLTTAQLIEKLPRWVSILMPSLSGGSALAKQCESQQGISIGKPVC